MIAYRLTVAFVAGVRVTRAPALRRLPDARAGGGVGVERGSARRHAVGVGGRRHLSPLRAAASGRSVVG